MWQVLQTEEFEGWLATLNESVKEDIFANVTVLGVHGPSLGRPRVDTIKNSIHKNMKELRVQSSGNPYRIFFAFDPERRAILLIGGNKKGDNRFYDKFIPIADKLFDQYLEDI
ncbi:type II toxin-antitoxin system RelE/ParE family toxin [Leptospira meyeri]|uniref:type II toxin-antitoxin system RelE/ParE family toxin n=1 Tax=Leptospira meyeri TaxID=29508 RepID=UPI0002BD71E7|nr:type II toxin-antitoxin system RelE/ParE family toxin [Leptospira meyeri]EMJ85358.1 Gp49-like PF05973 family protein [Leptospira meyeri serovar Semaranga str. Veldrot Semarang 173]